MSTLTTLSQCVELLLKMTFGKCWSTLPVHLRSDTPWATWLSICGVNLGGAQAQGLVLILIRS